MPFKTRKHKESAQKRRVSFAQNATVFYTKSKSTMQQELKANKSNIEPKNYDLGEFSSDFISVKKDLLAVFAISFFIVLAQFVLFSLKLN